MEKKKERKPITVAVKKWLRNSQPAIAAQIAVFIILLIISGIVLVVMWGVYNYIQAWQQSVFPTGVYDPTVLTWLSGLIIWSGFSVLIIGALWLWQRGQDRSPNEIGN